MAEYRGRPLAYVMLALAAWTGARVMVQPVELGDPASASALFPRALAAQAAFALPSTIVAEPPQPAKAIRRPPSITAPQSYSGLHAAMDPWQNGGRPSGLSAPLWVAEDGKPLSSGRDTPPTNAPALVGKAGTPLVERRWGATLYAYSFWRIRTGGGQTLAPQGQYGGSQSGLVATVDPFGRGVRGVSLLLRGAYAPDGSEKEVALGLRWQPISELPVSFSAERRFRLSGPDRFAGYFAGGFDRVPLVGKLSLEAYGQAGFASGKGGGGFFDAHARLTHPITEIGGIRISAGVGGWAGGQRSAGRYDTGPSVAARVDAGPMPILLQLDWRLRVAGNAQPKNGLALTVSTGF